MTEGNPFVRGDGFAKAPKAAETNKRYEGSMNVQMPHLAIRVGFGYKADIHFVVERDEGAAATQPFPSPEFIDLPGVELKGAREEVYASWRRILQVAEEERERLTRLNSGYQAPISAEGILHRDRGVAGGFQT